MAFIQNLVINRSRLINKKEQLGTLRKIPISNLNVFAKESKEVCKTRDKLYNNTFNDQENIFLSQKLTL